MTDRNYSLFVAAYDKGDYDAIVKAVNEGDEKIVEAVES